LTTEATDAVTSVSVGDEIERLIPMIEATESPVAEAQAPAVVRPGISAEMLARAGVRRVSAAEAHKLCGLEQSGLWVPYRTAEGVAIVDGGKAYGRLRLDKPQGSKKYHQAFGTGVHAYVPPGFENVPTGGDVPCVEGEFKALSLTEAGFPTIGLSGFFGFAQKGGEALVPELAAIIARVKPARIIFSGDSDTALNYQFSVAAVRFAKLLHPIPVYLPRIPFNGPGKGADDCREVFAGNFPEWWRDRVDQAALVRHDMDPALLAVELFEREQGALASLRGEERHRAEHRLVKLAAALQRDALLQERILDFAVKKLGINRRSLTRAVKSEVAKGGRAGEPEELEAYYDPTRKCYWMANDRGEMIEVNETSLERHLRKAGFAGKEEGEAVSAVEEKLIQTQTSKDVLYAGPLAGHPVGPQDMCGQRILVTRAPRVLKPVEGECPTIEGLITALLDDPVHDQISYLMGWLKIAYEALASWKLRHGQALAIAGPRDCGKSLLQNIITEILGGRSAKPYRYMCGATDFNGDLFGAEHLMIEDEVAFTDIRARRAFGARIKDFTVNTVQSCHAKNRQALSLKPLWRTSITLNDEPENLLILPPIDESLEDKIILLKAYKRPLPMDTSTLEGRQRFMSALLAEVPAFLNLLVNFPIPARLKSERFGVTHFHHPELLASLSEMSPEMRLLALIDAHLSEGDGPANSWMGTATELERVLYDSKGAHEARRLLDWSNATGTYLGRLAKKLPHRVRQERTKTSRIWYIRPPQWAGIEPEPVTLDAGEPD